MARLKECKLNQKTGNHLYALAFVLSLKVELVSVKYILNLYEIDLAHGILIYFAFYSMLLL